MIGDDTNSVILFADNVHGTGECGIFVGTFHDSCYHTIPPIEYEAFLSFNEDTPWQAFKLLYRTSWDHYFDFMYPPWPKWNYEHVLLTVKDSDTQRKLNVMHCLEFVYPLIDER